MDKADHMITAGTPTFWPMGVDNQGLVWGHAYTVLSTVVVTDANGVSTRLVKLRNPLARDYFNGDWSDSSDKWTDDLK